MVDGKSTRRRELPALASRHGVSRALLDDRATADTIDAALLVHEELGSWHEAATYKRALALEVAARGLTAHQDTTLSVLYRQRVVGSFAADLLVDERVLVLVRAAPELTAELRTETVRGIAAGGVRVGLVFNFGQPELFFARVF